MQGSWYSMHTQVWGRVLIALKRKAWRACKEATNKANYLIAAHSVQRVLREREGQGRGKWRIREGGSRELAQKGKKKST